MSDTIHITTTPGLILRTGESERDGGKGLHGKETSKERKTLNRKRIKGREGEKRGKGGKEKERMYGEAK